MSTDVWKSKQSREYHQAYRDKNSIDINNRRRIRKTKKKQQIIDEMGGCCSACGYSKCLRALQFHHVDPTSKLFELSRNLDHPVEVLREEAKKCVILCANCHFEEHDSMKDIDV